MTQLTEKVLATILANILEVTGAKNLHELAKKNLQPKSRGGKRIGAQAFSSPTCGSRTKAIAPSDRRRAISDSLLEIAEELDTEARVGTNEVRPALNQGPAPLPPLRQAGREAAAR